MAKKKTHKKQSFKYAEPTAPRTETLSTKGRSIVNSTTTSPAATAISLPDYPYLKGDLLRLATIAAVLIGAELGLWYLFGHTSVGTTVYNFYHL